MKIEHVYRYMSCRHTKSPNHTYGTSWTCKACQSSTPPPSPGSQFPSFGQSALIRPTLICPTVAPSNTTVQFDDDADADAALNVASPNSRKVVERGSSVQMYGHSWSENLDRAHRQTEETPEDPSSRHLRRRRRRCAPPSTLTRHCVKR
jgi:hypothetical protein